MGRLSITAVFAPAAVSHTGVLKTQISALGIEFCSTAGFLFPRNAPLFAHNSMKVLLCCAGGRLSPLPRI